MIFLLIATTIIICTLPVIMYSLWEILDELREWRKELKS
jgi:hypothetical protein